MKQVLALASLAILAGTLFQGCSVDIFPVSASRVKSARRAARVIEKGPSAPGYFKYAWSFAPSSSQAGMTLGGGFLMDPTHVEISRGSLHLKGSSNKMQVVQATSGRPYVALDGFTETLGSESRGVVKYQISNDGQRWFWFDGSKWTPATLQLDRANTGSEVNGHIQAFSLDVGAGSLYFKALMQSPSGNEPVEIQKIEISGIAPENDSWD